MKKPNDILVMKIQYINIIINAIFVLVVFLLMCVMCVWKWY